MTFELYTAVRERCTEDLATVTMRLGELEEALMLEADCSAESSHWRRRWRRHGQKVSV